MLIIKAHPSEGGIIDSRRVQLPVNVLTDGRVQDASHGTIATLEDWPDSDLITFGAAKYEADEGEFDRLRKAGASIETRR